MSASLDIPANASDIRARTYKRLMGRNRRVAVARWAVPILGTLVFLALAAQIYISRLGGQLSLAGLTIDRNTAVIEAPEYAGVLSDGTAYRVAASQARAPLGSTDKITLLGAWVVLTDPDGGVTKAEAAEALLDTTSQEIYIEGAADVENSDGTLGRFEDVTIDWQTQVFTATGGASLLFEDGTTIVADGAVYSIQSGQWQFTRSTVSLPQTPGADDEAGAVGEVE